MKKTNTSFGLLFVLILMAAFTFHSCLKQTIVQNDDQVKQEIDQVIHHWHEAAAQAHFEKYFGLMTDDAVFIGTDASERWDKKAFETYAKPHFDKRKAWTFKTLERHIMLDSLHQIAWFDELLDTSFKICRGSGVMKKVDNEWKIQHYVLSMTIPNEQSKLIVSMKDSLESEVIRKLNQKK